MCPVCGTACALFLASRRDRCAWRAGCQAAPVADVFVHRDDGSLVQGAPMCAAHAREAANLDVVVLDRGWRKRGGK